MIWYSYVIVSIVVGEWLLRTLGSWLRLCLLAVAKGPAWNCSGCCNPLALHCSAKMLGRSFVALSSWLLWILRACNYCRRPKEGSALQSENSQDSAEDSQLRGRHCVDQILETSGMHPFEHVASLLIWQLKADFSPSRTVKDIYRSYVQLYNIYIYIY